MIEHGCNHSLHYQFYAVEDNRLDLTAELIKEDADVNEQDVDEVSPLHIASKWEEEEEEGGRGGRGGRGGC